MWAQTPFVTVVDRAHRPFAYHRSPHQSINVLNRLDLRSNNTHPSLWTTACTRNTGLADLQEDLCQPRSLWRGGLKAPGRCLGHLIVHTSESLSLATLATWFHIAPQSPLPDHVALPADIPDELTIHEINESAFRDPSQHGYVVAHIS
jgi:hypothetical protein